MKEGKYSLRSLSARSKKMRLVYVDKNGKETNLGVFPNGNAAERKMISHMNATSRGGF